MRWIDEQKLNLYIGMFLVIFFFICFLFSYGCVPKWLLFIILDDSPQNIRFCVCVFFSGSLFFDQHKEFYLLSLCVYRTFKRGHTFTIWSKTAFNFLLVNITPCCDDLFSFDVRCNYFSQRSRWFMPGNNPASNHFLLRAFAQFAADFSYAQRCNQRVMERK